MHTSACVSCVRACTNRNEKEKADSLVIFPFFCLWWSFHVFPCLSMSFHLHIPVHPSAIQCHQVLPPPSHPAWALPRSWLQPGRIWSLHPCVQHRAMRSKSFQARGRLGLSWSLVLYCVCFVFLFGCVLDSFWLVSDDAGFGMLLGCQKSCHHIAARCG